jgi:hypothetical protein
MFLAIHVVIIAQALSIANENSNFYHFWQQKHHEVG